MRQQLQQAGGLQHLTAVMTSMAADLGSEAPALTGQSGDELCSNLDRFEVCNSSAAQRQLSLMQNIHRMLICLRQLSSSTGQMDWHDWLCDSSSGHAEAAMQLCTAALQHTSSALQHRRKAAVELGDYLTGLLDEVDKYQITQQGEQGLQQRLQQLLLSPHCLPFLATSVALQSSFFNSLVL
jgi:hypothetical protein